MPTVGETIKNRERALYPTIEDMHSGMLAKARASFPNVADRSDGVALAVLATCLERQNNELREYLNRIEARK